MAQWNIDSLEFKHFWMVAGPLISLYIITSAYRKSKQPNTFLRRYNSIDVCIFFELWALVISNVTFALLNCPPIKELVPCTIRIWVVLWVGSIAVFNHLPSMLDFCMRMFNPLFYEMHHARSPYNLLFIIVLCTWIPFLSTCVTSQSFYQNADNFTRCDSLKIPIFFNVIGRVALFFLIIFSRLFIIILGVP